MHENENGESQRSYIETKCRWVHKNHPERQIIGDKDSVVKTRIKLCYDE